jgi:biopolymer transport protein ExbD
VIFSRRKRKTAGIDLTPLIDSVFLLLVFLILTTGSYQPSLALELPSGSTDDPSAEQAVLVELASSGSVHIDGSPVDAESLEQALTESLAPLELRVVRLRAAKDAPYEAVVSLIETGRRAGAEAFDLVHEEARR